MKANLKLLFLILLLQIGCLENTALKTVNENNPVSPVNAVQSNTIANLQDAINANLPAMPAKTDAGMTTELTEEEKDLFYTVLLDQIAYREDSEELSKSAFQTGILLVYGKNTIPPQNFDRLKNDREIPESLLLNFEKANQKKERLKNNYDVYLQTKPFVADADTLKFYEAAKRKYPETYSVVNFSNVGIDDTYSTGLVYVEYYRPGRGLDRFYYEMVMDKIAEESRLHVPFTNVKTFRKIPVN